ncbi:uncharacterized protein GIQ15_00629 [Arthroderma uncinatum]|uniref:uncharacterized protein n=1 Tax=Arthroderma uncinatum TaxID=74035 RepID=UPI00144A6F7D|nr:uncharacterized protein GIQ15_00629 [Arthroderma uncinatum]KAF3491112.1 hypothetical protein GIQ15_00629 [Arthroderma uncinatum]
MENIKPETLRKKLERPSSMAAKWKLMPKGWKPPEIHVDPKYERLGLPGFFDEYYIFFYGTLMDKNMLAKVLDMSPDSERLNLRPARIDGYHTKLWGPYPALRHGPDFGHFVEGMAFEVHNQAEVDRLCAYETDKYLIDACAIEFLDIENSRMQKVFGKTFVWNGSPEELTEGKYNPSMSS